MNKETNATRAEESAQWRIIANKRLAARQAANTPWPRHGTFPEYKGDNRSPRPDPNAPEPSALTIGQRYSVRCPLPNIQLAQHSDRLQILEAQLAATFGGFTKLTMEGIWRAPSENGALETMHEHGILFDVSAETLELARVASSLFHLAGDAIGERAIHVEIHMYQARHFETHHGGTS